MAAERTCQFLLQVTAVEDDLGGPEAAEEFALALRTELAGLDVTRIDELQAPAAPEGTRSVAAIAAFGLLLTVVQTVAVLPAVVAAIKQFAAAYAQRRQPVRLAVAGVEFDPVNASDRELEHVVQKLLELPSQAQTGTRSALVVANARYDDERLAQLRSPGHDAQALARVLGDPTIGGFQVDLLMDADERTVRRRTAAFFADRDRDDLLLLHFSCHGVKDLRGRLHLAARDTDLSVLGATGIPASFVNDLLADTHSRRVVLVLDCCYSGAFARGGQVRAGNEVHVADEFGAGSGRIVLTASSATEYAFEGGELTEAQASPSAFTGALVAGLESGEADLDADGEISIDELYDYTYRTVRQTTPGQAPMKWSFGVEGSLVIARSARPAVLPAWIHEDLLSDRVVLRLEAVRGLSEILSLGKPGLRASAIGTLTHLRDHDDSVRIRQAAAAALATTGAVARTGHDGAAVPMAAASAQPVAAVGTTQPSRSVEPAAPAVAPQPPPAKPRPAKPPPAKPELMPEPPVDHGAPAKRGRDVLLLAGGALVLLSLLLYLIAAFSDELHWWTANPAWLAELVAVTLLLGTRRPIWSGALVGLLAWEWLYSGVIVFGDTDIDHDLLPLYGAANLVAIAALVCLMIPIVRARPRLRELGGDRIAGNIAVAVLAIVTAMLAATLAWEAADLDDYSGDAVGWWLLITGLACALVLPLVGVSAPGRPSAMLAPLGWLVGGLPFAIIASSELGSDYAAAQAWTYLLLVATVGGALVTNRRRHHPDQQRHEGRQEARR